MIIDAEIRELSGHYSAVANDAQRRPQTWHFREMLAPGARKNR